MNWLKKAYDNTMGRIGGMDEVSDLQNNLSDYYMTSLEEAASMSGHDANVFALDDANYDDIGGRPSPLNPNQFPTREEIDAIRHYYGPQVMAEAGGALGDIKSVIGPAYHEVEGLAKGEGWAQIGPDLYNNMVSTKDRMFGDDTMPAMGLLNRLKAFEDESDTGSRNRMPPGEFERYAEHALDRTMIPPKQENVGY